MPSSYHHDHNDDELRSESKIQVKVMPRLTKQIRERTTIHKREPINKVNDTAAIDLDSFSVIWLLMVGFEINGHHIKCSRCSCSYTAAEMEQETDDSLMTKHFEKSSNCRVLTRITTDYDGKLRRPGARAPQPSYYSAHDYSTHIQPYVQQFTTHPPVTNKSANLQDDIISDSHPGKKFYGFGPSSHKLLENRSNTANIYGEYTDRFHSFGNNWKNRAKKNSRPDPELLARAGLYAYPQERRDAAKCFECKTVLYGWKDNEDVWKKHAQWSPTCAHVLKEKGEEYVRTVSAQTTRKPATKQSLTDLGIDPKWVQNVCEMGFTLDDFLLVTMYKQYLEPDNTEIFSDIQEPINMILHKKQEAEANYQNFGTNNLVDGSRSDDGTVESGESHHKYEETQCKVCFLYLANMVLKPCGHLNSCEICTKRLKKCLECKKPIAGVFRIAFDDEN